MDWFLRNRRPSLLRPVWAGFLVVAILGLFGFSTLEPLRAFDFDDVPLSEAFYPWQTDPVDCINLGWDDKNTLQSLRMGSLKQAVLSGAQDFRPTFSGSHSLGYPKGDYGDIRGSIYLKLRI
jgi:hypothetical protein